MFYKFINIRIYVLGGICVNQNLKFGKCLNLVLSTLDINYSKLARAINVDSSLVSRWANDIRIPPYDSNHIDNIVAYISDIVENDSYRLGKLQNLLLVIGGDKCDKNETLKKRLMNLFICSQQFSIEQNKKTKILLSNGGNNSSKNDYCKSKLMEMGLRDEIKTKSLSSKDRVINGGENAIEEILDKLDKASKLDGWLSEPILFNLGGSIDGILNSKEIVKKFKNILKKLLDNSWQIVFNVFLYEDNVRTIKVLNFVRELINYRNFSMYYFRGNSPSDPVTEMVILPKISAFIYFRNDPFAQIDTSFYFESNSTIEMFVKSYYELIIYSVPLITARLNNKNKYDEIYFGNEFKFGDRFMYGEMINDLNISMNTYEKFLYDLEYTCEEFNYRLSGHEKKLKMFEYQIKYYNYKDIYIKEDVEKFLMDMAFQDKPFFKNSTLKPNKNYIVEYLNNTIFNLKNYDNYKIGLIDDKPEENYQDYKFLIKGRNFLMIDTNNRYDDFSSELASDFLIDEPMIVQAHKDYFNNLWDKLPSNNKNKKNVIEWIQSQIDKIFHINP